MKGRQKSLTAFLKATNLSSCLLADLLILLLMILYSSSLWFFLILFHTLCCFIPFLHTIWKRKILHYLSVSEYIPSPTNAQWDPKYQHGVIPTEPGPLVAASLISQCDCALPLPLGSFVSRINLPLAKPALRDPRRSSASIPFWTLPQLMPWAHFLSSSPSLHNEVLSESPPAQLWSWSITLSAGDTWVSCVISNSRKAESNGFYNERGNK